MDKRLLWFGLVVFGVIVIAIGYRFYALQNYPPGLFPDQAANGEDALLILTGDWRPFFERGNGREGLFFFLQALSIQYLGVGVWPMFVASAAVGVLTVIAIYFATQAFFGRLAGILAAFFAATSYWHVTISRTGFRAILAPLFLAAFTAFVGYAISAAKERKPQHARGRRALSYVYAALAGVAFAGGFYSYISYRAILGVVAAVTALLLLAALHEKIGFPHFRHYGGQMAAGLVAAVIVMAPLAWYFVQHPASLVGRAGQVSIFNTNLQREVGAANAWEALRYSTRETIKGFFAGSGDRNWRHSVAGYPLLNPVVGLLFLVGVVWTLSGTVGVLWRMTHGAEVHLGMVYPYLLLLLVGMMAPVALTLEGLPHGLRSLGMFFPIMVLAGTAAAVIIHWVHRRLTAAPAREIGLGLIFGILVLSGLYDGALYFFVARNTADAYYAYRADLTEVTKFLREHGDDRPYLVLDDFSVQTVHFLQHDIYGDGTITPPPHDFTHGDEPHPDEAQHIYTLVKPELSSKVALQPGELIIFTQSTMPEAQRYQAAHPGIEVVESRKNRFGQEVMRVYMGAAGQSVPLPVTPSEPAFDLDAGI